MLMVYQDLPVIHGTGEILRDERSDWRKLKLKSQAVSNVLPVDTKYWLGRSQRMFDCGSTLEFAVDTHGNKRLLRAMFCRDRICPSCQKRRSLVMFHQVKSVCQVLQRQHPTMRYLLLTLTVPNVKGEELSDSLSHMTSSFYRLMKRAEVKRSIRGFFRALEVTYNGVRGDYHPHFHVLLAVPSGYFKKNYIKQARWLELWQEATRDPSITQVDIRPVKPNPKKEGSTDIESAAAEVAKYATKPSNYICSDVNGNYYAAETPVRQLASSIKGKRLVSFGGVMKDIHAELHLLDVDSDEVDLVHVTDESDMVDAVMVQVYRWNLGLRNYIN